MKRPTKSDVQAVGILLLVLVFAVGAVWWKWWAWRQLHPSAPWWLFIFAN